MRIKKFLSAKCPVWSGICLSCGRRRRLYCCVAIEGGGSSPRRTWVELLLILLNNRSSRLAYCNTNFSLYFGQENRIFLATRSFLWLKHTHTHTRLTALFPGLPGWAGTRKVKPIWILLEQATMSGSGISWAICMSAPRSRQITMPAPHHSVFYRPDAFLPPNQQHQSTEGTS